MKPIDTCKGFKLCPFNCSFVLVHLTEDLALKSPKIMVNKELDKVVSLKTFSKFDKRFSNSKLFWFGDLYATPT